MLLPLRYDFFLLVLVHAVGRQASAAKIQGHFSVIQDFFPRHMDTIDVGGRGLPSSVEGGRNIWVSAAEACRPTDSARARMGDDERCSQKRWTVHSRRSTVSPK